MTGSERLTKWLLRVAGASMVIAIVPAVMPRSWMAWAHERLGLGQFPPGVLTEYLARSVSGLYAMLGGLLWLASFDVRRHLAVLRYVGVAFVVLGAVLLLALPGQRDQVLYWATVVDGLAGLAFGAALLALLTKVRKDV